MLLAPAERLHSSHSWRCNMAPPRFPSQIYRGLHRLFLSEVSRRPAESSSRWRSLTRRSQFLQALAPFRALFEGVITLQFVSRNFPP